MAATWPLPLPMVRFETTPVGILSGPWLSQSVAQSVAQSVVQSGAQRKGRRSRDHRPTVL